MNKGIKYLILMTLLMLMSLNSHANDYLYYLGLGAGQSSFNLNESNIIASTDSLNNDSTFNDSASTLNLFAGLPLDEHLALEIDLALLGDISANSGGRTIKLFDVSTISITAVLSKQVSENIKLFGKIGAHAWDISESSGDLDTINNAVDLTYGLGVDINLYGEKSRQFRIQWNYFEYDGVFIDSNDTLTISLLFLIGGD